MTAEEKLEKIREIYDTKTKNETRGFVFTTSTHARHNLEGALMDLERTREVDDVCLETIKRVIKQLAEIEKVLEA